MKTSIKALIMAIVAFLATTISEQLTHGALNWAYTGIATVGIILAYLGKNAMFQSISPFGTLDTRDILSGLLIALGTAVSSFAASIITAGHVDWKQLGIACFATITGYFAQVLPRGQTS